MTPPLSFPFRRYMRIIIGSLLLIAGHLLYYFRYHPVVIWVWFASLCFFCTHFYLQRRPGKIIDDFNKYDVYIMLALYIFFIPVYLWFIEWIPYQVGPDELHFFNAIAGHVDEGWKTDPFGVSSYFGFAKLIFLIFGYLAKILPGGMNFVNLRTVHAVFGLVCIFPAYIFYRLFWPRVYALGATVVLMSHHVLVDISRMLSRNNVPLLNLLGAFILLFVSLRKRCPWYAFWGGIASGLSFYHYCVGRIIFFVWLFYVIVLSLFFRKEIPFPVLRRLTLISTFGFLMTIAPIMSHSMFKVSKHFFDYGRNQLLIFKEGREHQKQWVGVRTAREGIHINIINGLTFLNRKLPDMGHQYENMGYGFVDPLTGILVWVGLLSLIVKGRNGKSPGNMLIFSSFIFLLLVFLFVSNETPNYTRLLIMLPIIIFLSVEGLQAFIQIISMIPSKRFLKAQVLHESKTILFFLGLTVIVYWNGFMIGDYFRKGLVMGDQMRSTLRFIQQKKMQTTEKFYILADNRNDYFTSGFIGGFSRIAGDPKRLVTIDNTGFPNTQLTPPFILFMERRLWMQSRQELIKEYPFLIEYSMMPDSNFLAIEVR